MKRGFHGADLRRAQVAVCIGSCGGKLQVVRRVLWLRASVHEPTLFPALDILHHLLERLQKA
jgi:hypothetical protein